MNDNKTYPNTQTFLIEASRGDSIIDNKDNNDYNSKWSTETSFQLKRGDTVSVEMVALNAQNAGSSQTIEFTGEKVIVDGEKKKYCDNKVLLEVFYYINNNNTYSVGLPLIHPQGGFCNTGTGSFSENLCQPVQYGTAADGINNRNMTVSAGSMSFLNVNVVSGEVKPVIDATKNHFIVAFKDFTGTYVSSIAPVGNEIIGVVLGKTGDTNTKSGQFTDYASWNSGKWATNELCNIYKNMTWGCEGDDGILTLNNVEISNIIEQTATLPGGYTGTGRVELEFSERVVMSETANTSAGALFGLRWDDTKQGSSEIGLVNYDNINAGAFRTYPSYISKNRNLGHYMENITTSTAAMSPQYKYFLGGSSDTIFYGQSDTNLISTAKGNMYDIASNDGFRCGQVRHDNNGKPYILTRNDWCGQGRREVNSGNFLPKLEPLTAFILLEADELFTDVNALAQKINDKLHETLNLFDTEVAEQDNFLTNDELYPHLNTKTSSILPSIQTNGYIDPALAGGIVDQNYFSLYDAIQPVKFGGTVKIQPANFDDGVNMLYQASRMLIDDTTDDYIASTYIKKCPNPNINTEATENPIYGNAGYMNFYKAQLGDRWQRCSLSSLNTVASRKVAPAFGNRKCGKPVILNEKLIYKDVTLTLPGGFSTVKTTTMKKKQLIFTNLHYPQKDSSGNPIIPELEQQIRDLAKEIRKYEIYNNKVNGSNSYATQEKTNDWVFDFDIGITNDNKVSFVHTAITTTQYSPMSMPWTDEYPETASQATDATYGTGMDGSVRELICPSFTTPGFGIHHTNFYWLTQFSAYRGLGNIYIESRFDPNYFTTSKDMNSITGGVSIDANNQLIDGDKYKIQSNIYPDMELIKELNIGLYPYIHIDEDGNKEIFIALRCGEDYEATSENPLSVQLGCVTWGNTIGVSPSAADNHMICPMNADAKNVNRTFPVPSTGQLLNRGLRPNRNNMIWCGANNPTFQFNSDKNRYEFVNLQSDQLLSSLNTSVQTGTSQLGDKVGIVNAISPDAVFTTITSRGSINKGVRDAISGVGVYKVWLCPPDYNPPPNINLVNYWDNSTITKTQENHDTITKGCIEASPTEWESCFLDRCGFDYYSLFPKYGYQFNRFDPVTYNNEDPKVIGQGTKPLILNNSLNNVTNPSLSLYYDPRPTPPGSAIPSGVPNFGLGMYSNLSVLLSTQSLPLTASSSPILTTSPFYIIYSDVVGDRNYQSGSTPLPAVFYCMRNYSNSGFFYGYGSSFQIMINQDRHLSLINTEIRNPNGELAKLSKNSTIMYKIQRQGIVPPPQIDVFGQLENQQVPDPNQQELMQILQNTNNISSAMAGGSSVPSKGGKSKIGGGSGNNNSIGNIGGTHSIPSNSIGTQATPNVNVIGTQATPNVNSIGTSSQFTQEEIQTQTDSELFEDDVAIDQAIKEMGTGTDEDKILPEQLKERTLDRKVIGLIFRGFLAKLTANWNVKPPPEGDLEVVDDFFPVSIKKGENFKTFISRGLRQLFQKLDIGVLFENAQNNPEGLIDSLTQPATSTTPAGLLAGININSIGQVTYDPTRNTPTGRFYLEAMEDDGDFRKLYDTLADAAGKLGSDKIGLTNYRKIQEQINDLLIFNEIKGIYVTPNGERWVYKDISEWDQYGEEGTGMPNQYDFEEHALTSTAEAINELRKIDKFIVAGRGKNKIAISRKGGTPNINDYFEDLNINLKPESRKKVDGPDPAGAGGGVQSVSNQARGDQQPDLRDDEKK